MTMGVGQRYCCQDPNCRCEVEVIKASMEAALNPRCCCGGQMKMPYAKPTLKILDSKSAIINDFARDNDGGGRWQK